MSFMADLRYFLGNLFWLVGQILYIMMVISLIALSLPFMAIGYVAGFIVGHIVNGYRWVEIHQNMITNVKSDDDLTNITGA